MKYYFLLIPVFLTSNMAWADWVVKYRDADTGEQSQEYYGDNRANFGELIYTGKNIIAIDRESNAYWKGTLKQYCKALRDMKQKMDAQLASMPASYRPIAISDNKVTRKKIQKNSIAGLSATGYEFFVDGISQGSVWVTSDSKISDIIAFEKSMENKMKCFEGISSFAIEDTALYKKTVKGKFIVKELYREVVSVKQASVDSSSYKAPEGYASYSDYQKFMDHVSKNAGSSSGSSFNQGAFPEDMMNEEPHADMGSGTDSGGQNKQEDNVVVKDAKEIGRDVTKEAYDETKKGIKEEISKDVKKGVKDLLKGLF